MLGEVLTLLSMGKIRFGYNTPFTIIATRFNYKRPYQGERQVPIISLFYSDKGPLKEMIPRKDKIGIRDQRICTYSYYL